MTKKLRIADRNPLVVTYDVQDVHAIQALAKGVATEGQQIRALDLIVNGLACAFDTTFRPDSERLTSFAAGKAFVGQQIDKLIRLNPATMEKKADVSPRENG